MDGNLKSQIRNQQLSKELALQKLRYYCAYSERCHSDVVNKLYELNVWKKDHDEIIAALIEENYLNEERFARLFAGSHFRQKQWGRNKILQALKQKNISAYCIKAAMKEIDEDDYEKVLAGLFNEKWERLRGITNRFAKMKRISDYLLQKGYEADLINALLKHYPKK
ncbi:MAG: regulatory protein RecX [Niabella sp.]